MSNIRDRKVGADQLWDWAFLNESLTDSNGGQARPMDCDGMVEQWGHLLVLEGKPGGFTWPPGSAQRRAVRVFASRPGQVAIILYGDRPASPVIEEAEWCINGHWFQREKVTTRGVQALVRSWFVHARSGCRALTCPLDRLEEQNG